MGKRVTDDIYLDNQSAAKAAKHLLERMRSFHEEYFASSASPHFLGQQSHFPYMTALAKIYESMGASSQDAFYFMSGSAEGISNVFMSTYLQVIRETGKTHILSTAVEEAPILLSMKKLEGLGCSCKALPVNAKGQITREILEEAIRARTSLVSLSWANGLTGVMQPVEDLAELCREKQVLFHLDATHVIGKRFFRFQDLGVDFLTFDAGVLHAPRGHGGLFVRAFSPFAPLTVGANGENVPGHIVLGEILELAMQNFDHVCTETARLRDKLEKQVRAALPQASVLFEEVERLPNISCMVFPGVSSEALLYALNTKGLYASMGGGGFQKLSHLLTSCGIEPYLAHTALSFALSFDTTEDEVEKAVALIVEAYQKLRCYSNEIVEVSL